MLGGCIVCCGGDITLGDCFMNADDTFWEHNLGSGRVPFVVLAPFCVNRERRRPMRGGCVVWFGAVRRSGVGGIIMAGDSASGASDIAWSEIEIGCFLNPNEAFWERVLGAS